MVRIHVVWLKDKEPTDTFIKDTTNKINQAIAKFKHARTSTDSSTKNIYEMFGERNSIRINEQNRLIDATDELTLVWDDMYIRNQMSNIEELQRIVSDPKRLVLFVGKKEKSHSHEMIIVSEEELVNVLYQQACYICFEKKIENEKIENLTTGSSVLEYIKETKLSIDKNIRKPMIMKGEENKFVIIRRIIITIDTVTIMYEKRELNRMLYYRSEEIDKFMICQLDIKLSKLDLLSDILATSGIQTSSCQKFIFIGHSNSQLKEFSCYLYDGTQEEIGVLLKTFGNFSVIKQVAKYSARVGLLFSSCLDMFSLPSDTAIECQVKDIERNGMIFSDGCGLITDDLMEYISKEILKLKETVSVIQIRLRGCKGVLVKIPKETKTIKLRKSMEKFEWLLKGSDLMGIVQYSRPFKHKYMNEQVIMLLSALGVPDENLLRIQDEYFNSLDNILTKEEAIKWLLLKDNVEDAEIVLNSTDRIPEHIQKKLITIRDEEIKQNMVVVSRNEKTKEKLRIPIMDSRILFGVCDDGLYRFTKEKNRLKKGQCFIRVKQFDNPNPVIITGKVIVAKNPCYYPGDIRILEAVNIQDLNYLSECIIFNTEGDIPVAHSMAGSDLDGDQYFVCWREDLIPKKEVKPYGYPGGKVDSKEEIKIIDMVNQFIKFDRTISGSVDFYYHFFKDRLGVNSKECKDLGTKWFSKAVDSGKSGEQVKIPAEYIRYFKKHEKDPANPKFLWNIMKESMRKRYVNPSNNQVEPITTIEVFSKEDLEEIFLSNEESSFPYSEFYRFKMVHSWCVNSGYPFSEFIMQFDYSKIYNELALNKERKQFVRQVLLDNNINQKIFTNALYGSDILKQTEFKEFKSAERTELGFWKLYWRCDTKHSITEDRILLFKHMVDSLTRFREVMFVFQFSLNIKLVIEIDTKKHLKIGDNPIPYGVSSYLISYGKKRPYYMDDHALISISDNVIQIYRNEKRQTFVWIKLEEFNPTGDLFVNLSVDIESFETGIIRNNQHQKIRKQPFELIEVFIREQEGNLYSNEPLFYVFESNNQEIEEDEWPFKDESDKINQLQLFCENSIEKWYSQIQTNSTNDTTTQLLDQILSNILKLVELHGYQVVVRLFAKKTFLPPNTELQSLIIGCRIILGQSIHQYLSNNEELRKSLLPYMFAFPYALKSIDSDVLVASSDYKMYLLGGHLPTKKRSCSLKEYTHLVFHYILGMIIKNNRPKIQLATKLEIRFENSKEFDISLSKFDEIFELSDFKNINPKLGIFKEEYMDLLCLELAAEIRNSMLSQESLKKGKIILKDGEYELCIKEVSALDLLVGDFVLLISPFSLRNVFSRPTDNISFSNNGGHLIMLGTMGDSLQLNINVSDWQKKYVEVSDYYVIKLGNLVTFSRTMTAIHKCCAQVTEDVNPYLISKILENTTVPGREENVVQQVEIQQDRNSLLSNLRKIQLGNGLEFPCVLPGQYTESLNEFQQCAISQALCRKFHIIQGPPGTGKTNSIAHLVKYLIEGEMDGQILAVSETNHATDNMLLKMMEVLPKHHEFMLRVTGQTTCNNRGVHPNLVKLSLEFYNQTLKKEQKTRKQIKEKLKEKLKESKIICSTLAGCGLSVFKNTNIKFVIIDEVSQTTVQKVLIALTLSTEIERIVLVGDDKQLPPTIFSKIAQEKPSSQSLYNYLVNYNNVKPDILKIQYRMHPEIVKFSNECFYENELESGENTREYKKINNLKSYVTFQNVQNGAQKRKGTSLFNEEEAQKVLEQIQSILENNKNEISSSDIGIITPYLAQVETIKLLLDKHNLGNIEVKSVDGFQGREKIVIIVSMVRTIQQQANGEVVESFISDRRRLNVMLTRAKRALIIIGHRQTLAHYEYWKKWLEMYNFKKR